MAVEVFVPKLGQTVEEVTLVKWLAPDGAKVDRGQEILEVETDKAIFAVEAPARGYLHRGPPFEEHMVVPVLTVVATIGAQDEVFMAAGRAGEEASLLPVGLESVEPGEALASAIDGSFLAERRFASPRARRLAQAKGVDLASVTPTGGGGARVVERDVIAYLAQMPKATPVAQRVAAEVGLDLRRVSGSGPRGTIMRVDVERVRGETAEPAVAEPLPLVAKPVELTTPLAEAGNDVVKRVPLLGVRKIISERMATSVHTTARVTLMTEADATEFVAARQKLKAAVAESWGFAPGYNDLLARIVATALVKFPYMNARITPEAVEYLGRINLGMAVDTERGLIVTVIRDAASKSLYAFAAEFRGLVERARQGRSMPDDLTGGTFTITNLGMYDVDAFTPVINLPEAAILGVGRIVQKVVPYEGQVAVRDRITLCLAFDHRLVDGAPAARFLQYVKQVVEQPYLLLVG